VDAVKLASRRFVCNQ